MRSNSGLAWRPHTERITHAPLAHAPWLRGRESAASGSSPLGSGGTGHCANHLAARAVASGVGDLARARSPTQREKSSADVSRPRHSTRRQGAKGADTRGKNRSADTSFGPSTPRHTSDSPSGAARLDSPMGNARCLRRAISRLRLARVSFWREAVTTEPEVSQRHSDDDRRGLRATDCAVLFRAEGLRTPNNH